MCIEEGDGTFWCLDSAAEDAFANENLSICEVSNPSCYSERVAEDLNNLVARENTETASNNPTV